MVRTWEARSLTCLKCCEEADPGVSTAKRTTAGSRGEEELGEARRERTQPVGRSSSGWRRARPSLSRCSPAVCRAGPPVLLRAVLGAVDAPRREQQQADAREEDGRALPHKQDGQAGKHVILLPVPMSRDGL